eukprot:gene16147-28518_t
MADFSALRDTENDRRLYAGSGPLARSPSMTAKQKEDENLIGFGLVRHQAPVAAPRPAAHVNRLDAQRQLSHQKQVVHLLEREQRERSSDEEEHEGDAPPLPPRDFRSLPSPITTDWYQKDFTRYVGEIKRIFAALELAVSYVEAQARITRALKDPKGRHPFVIRPSGSEAGCYAICLVAMTDINTSPNVSRLSTPHGLITNKMTSTGISRFSFQVQDQPTFKQLTLLVDYYREHDIGPCVSTEMQTYSGLYLDGVVGEGGREANTPLDNQPMSPIRIPFKVSVKTPLGMSWFCREGVDGLIVRRINPHSAIQDATGGGHVQPGMVLIAINGVRYYHGDSSTAASTVRGAGPGGSNADVRCSSAAAAAMDVAVSQQLSIEDDNDEGDYNLTADFVGSRASLSESRSSIRSTSTQYTEFFNGNEPATLPSRLKSSKSNRGTVYGELYCEDFAKGHAARRSGSACDSLQQPSGNAGTRAVNPTLPSPFERVASGESIRGFAGLDITPQSSSQPGHMNNSTAAKAADGGGGDYLDGFESRKASKISRKKSEMSGKFGFGDDSLSRTPTSRSNGSQTSVASSNISGVGFHSNGGEDVDSDTECDVDDYQSDDPPSLSALKPPAPTKRRPPSPPPSPSRLTKGHL